MANSFPRVLDPIDRLSEILFGLIMALTFTGSLSVAQAGREDVRTMLAGALGCNIAWGIIDAILFLMGLMADRSQGVRAWRRLKQSADPIVNRQIVADALSPEVASVLTTAELDTIGQRLVASPYPNNHPPRLDAQAWLGALAVFVLVVVTTFPIVVPFLLSDDAERALRASNAIAVAMLFVTGFLFARLTDRSPWLVGVLMVFLGAALVGLTMALGG